MELVPIHGSNKQSTSDDTNQNNNNDNDTNNNNSIIQPLVSSKEIDPESRTKKVIQKAFQALHFQADEVDENECKSGCFGYVVPGTYTTQHGCFGMFLSKNRKAVVKVIKWNESNNHASFSSQVSQEISLLCRFGGKNNIVRCYNGLLEDYFLTDKCETPLVAAGFILMEALEINLKDYLKNNGNLTLDTIRQLAVCIGTALNYLHENQVTHLDIKPANIMIKRLDANGLIDPNKTVFKLVDFGLARQQLLMREICFIRKVLGGTPFWMAPEVLQNYKKCKNSNLPVQLVNPYLADTYGFGATLIYSITGDDWYSLYKGDHLGTKFEEYLKEKYGLLRHVDPRIEAICGLVAEMRQRIYVGRPLISVFELSRALKLGRALKLCKA